MHLLRQQCTLAPWLWSQTLGVRTSAWSHPHPPGQQRHLHPASDGQPAWLRLLVPFETAAQSHHGRWPAEAAARVMDLLSKGHQVHTALPCKSTTGVKVAHAEFLFLLFYENGGPPVSWWATSVIWLLMVGHHCHLVVTNQSASWQPYLANIYVVNTDIDLGTGFWHLQACIPNSSHWKCHVHMAKHDGLSRVGDCK